MLIGLTPSCILLQEELGLGTHDLPFKPCSLDACTEWCRLEYGRSVGSNGFGCQIYKGVETLAFCECSDGGHTDSDFSRAILCREPVGCSECDHGYCSTSSTENTLHKNMCSVCEPGFVLLPTGTCVTAQAQALVAKSIYTCPMNDPCIHGICIDGNAVLEIPYSCKCWEGFEGPLCNSGYPS